MTICAWFKCRREFEAPRVTMRFCSPKCRSDDKLHRMKRGATAFNPLLDWRACHTWPDDRRAEYIAKHGCSPVVRLQRLADAMAAEMRDYRP